MNYYLLKKELFFIDPHGSPDEAGVSIKVVKSELIIDESLCYQQEIHDKTYWQQEELDERIRDFHNREEIEDYWNETIVDENEWSSNEDGYNSKETVYTYKQITEEYYNQYEKIILEHNKILATI